MYYFYICHMILIADSGSTKTSWYFFNGKTELRLKTGGINPFFRDTENIVDELEKELLPNVDAAVGEIHFYGAGIINSEKGNVVADALKMLFPNALVEVESDLAGAARALLKYNSGIACILGTGSNSCLYNGTEITEKVPPLGFILGDEGSGAVLGRKLLGDYLKGLMPDRLSEKFQTQFPFSYPEMLERVYKTEKPNKFLARFVPFLKDNIEEEYCRVLLEQSFDEFVRRNIMQYKNYGEQLVSFVGSVAFYFQDQLRNVLARRNLKSGLIVKEPLEGLIEFHLNKQNERNRVEFTL